MKRVLFLLTLIVTGFFSIAQQATFNVKELLVLKDHNTDFFKNYVTKKGYTYEKSKYEQKKDEFSYILMADISHDLYNIDYIRTGGRVSITYGSTDSADYQQLKSQLELLQFRFVRYVDKQEDGRPVLMMVYTDGHNHINLYNSYIEDDDHVLVKYYRIKVM